MEIDNWREIDCEQLSAVANYTTDQMIKLHLTTIDKATQWGVNNES